MKIFETSKQFPKEEKYSLTDQIRRSSRSVCANISEGYRKRVYPAHFISKMTDADAENTETRVWLDFALACQYLFAAEHETFYKETEEIGRLLNDMIKNPEKYSKW